MAYDVFISYSSNDQKIVEGLSAYLEQNGIRCFVAYRDIPRGVVWAEAITNAIEDCQMMIVVFSEHFNSSKQVDREIEMCSEDKKPILTFKIQNVAFTGAKRYYLKNLNWIDAFPKPEQSFGDLCESVRKLLPIDPDKETDTATPAPAPAPPKPEPTNQYILKIRPNLTCAVFVDDERRTEAPAGKITKLPLNKGTFLLEFVSTENKEDKYLIEEYASTDPEQLLHVDLESIKQKRVKKERIEHEKPEKERIEQERIEREQAKREILEQERQEREKKEKERIEGDGRESLEMLELVSCIYYGKYGFKDKATGNIIIQAKYDSVYSFHEGLAAVELSGKWGFIDKTGKVIIPLKYDELSDFSESLAIVKLNGKWGFVDKTGKEVIPLKYEYAGCFSKGLADVKLNNKFGFIDKTGKEVIPLIYDKCALSFKNGNAIVELNGEWFSIDKSGNRIS